MKNSSVIAYTVLLLSSCRSSKETSPPPSPPPVDDLSQYGPPTDVPENVTPADTPSTGESSGIVLNEAPPADSLVGFQPVAESENTLNLGTGGESNASGNILELNNSGGQPSENSSLNLNLNTGSAPAEDGLTLNIGDTPADIQNSESPTESSPVLTLSQDEIEGAQQASSRLKVLLLTEDASTQEYIVKKGDTLWDLSNQFFGDPLWWPKLWKKNPHIQNPHFIYPGMKVVFSPSDGRRPPSVGVTSQLDAKMTDYFGRLVAKWSQNSDGYFVSPNDLERDKRFLAVQDPIRVPRTLKTRLSGWAGYDDPPYLGRIPVFRDRSNLTQQGGRTYVQYYEDSLKVGERMLTARPLELNYDPKGRFTEGDLNIWIYTGLVRVTLQGGGRYDELEYGEVQIEENYQNISPGDYLLPYRNVHRIMDLGGGAPRPRLRSVVVAIGLENATVAGFGTNIFLSREYGSNVNLGDEIEIFMPEEGIIGYIDGLPMPWKLAGIAKVISLTPEMIEAVVIQVKGEISVGARTWAIGD